MNIPFKQHEFEAAIYRTLAYGDETRIAEATGKSPGYYSSLYNPEDPRESNLFKAAREIAILILNNEERGLDTLRVFNAFVERTLDGERSSDTGRILVACKKATNEIAEIQAATVDMLKMTAKQAVADFRAKRA